MFAIAALAALAALAAAAAAPRMQAIVIAPTAVTDWKAVFGRIETRDRAAARARTGGVLVGISVAEGDIVAAGDVIAVVADERLGFSARRNRCAARRAARAARQRRSRARPR